MSIGDIVALPPKVLIDRVGDDPGDTVGEYLNIGRRHRELVESYLPPDWEWQGKAYLDWGSGAGRLVRHFLPEAQTSRIMAADIHAPSIDWVREHLVPIAGLVVDLAPGVDLEDNTLDLVTGFSVMTHITDHWAGWLLEIRRILKPGGLALLSFCGEAMVPVLLDHPVAPDDVGMLVLKYDNPWRHGGPTVLHSQWWIRAHWGRAFEILRLDPAALQGVKTGHDLVLLRKPAGPPPSIEELEAPEPGDPRELAGLQSALAQSRADLSEMQAEHDPLRVAAYENRLLAEDRALKISVITASTSWRVTRPLRVLTGRWRGSRGPLPY